MKAESRVVSRKGNGRFLTELKWAKKKSVQLLKIKQGDDLEFYATSGEVCVRKGR